MLWWSDDLKTGIDEIDQYHKKIFDKAEEIMEFTESTPIDEINDFFDFLNNYVIDHFGHEERSMIKYLYPNFERHRHRHTNLIVSLYELNKKFAIHGINDKLVDDFKILIIQWLVNHIDVDDKDLAEFLRKLD